MPKSLHEWLHYQALQWWMDGEAVKFYHDGRWHRVSTDPDWTECGRWVAASRARAGFTDDHHRRKSPWFGGGHMDIPNLCRSCFAVELPLLTELQRVAIAGQDHLGDTGEKP